MRQVFAGVRKGLGVLAVLMLLQGCTDSYSNGYNDGWEGGVNYLLFLFNGEYRDGLRDGGQDVDLFAKVETAVEAYPNNIKKAAASLGMSTGQFQEKLNAFDIPYRGSSADE